jgi:siderophore synthetase component
MLRTLSPDSVKNAVIVTDILRDIFIKEDNFGQRLNMLPEIAGVF